MPRIAPVSGAEEVETARELFLEYAASLPVELEYQGFSSELAELEARYSPPGGALLLAWAGADPTGCVAVRPLHGRTCEMKRLYVRPAHRGSGLGPLLVRAAIRAARELGYEEMWLDTLPTMTDAHRLYEKLGFREIPPYGSAVPGSRFYGLRLLD